MAAPKVEPGDARVHRKDHEPDGYVFRNDADVATWLCVVCADVGGAEQANELTAWRHLTEHLRWHHRLRRVWVELDRPAVRALVQLAIPIAVAHNTTRPND